MLLHLSGLPRLHGVSHLPVNSQVGERFALMNNYFYVPRFKIESIGGSLYTGSPHLDP